MNRLLSVVSMGLARRWKTIFMFLGAWWIITSFLMKIFANGDFSTIGTYFPIYFDNEIGLILLIIGIGYIVEQFRLESQFRINKKRTNRKLIHPNSCRFWNHYFDLRLINSVKKWSFIRLSNDSITHRRPIRPRKYRYQHCSLFRGGCSNSPNRKYYWNCA